MSSPIPSTSDGGGGAPELSQEEIDKMVMDNDSGSEEGSGIIINFQFHIS